VRDADGSFLSIWQHPGLLSTHGKLTRNLQWRTYRRDSLKAREAD
jgi:hypothetical protein